jgi:hypothetical protein
LSEIELSRIAATSPTLAEEMRSCSLRAALSRAKSANIYVLGIPKGWLGSAYHQVLQKIAESHPKAEMLDETIEKLWTEAIGTQHRRVLAHPLDRRFDPPISWPGYYVTKASVALRARTLVPVIVPRPIKHEGRESSTIEAYIPYRERRFTAFAGKLVGRPDVVRENEIVDFKSGSIVEPTDLHGVDTIKAAYLRQLMIYGFLVHETLGRWPHRGILLPAVGSGVELQLIPQDCQREALAAVELLDTYNGKIAKNASIEEFAAPSPEHCKWCPYKVLCPPFWATASPDWSRLIDGAAVEGAVVDMPKQIHGGAALAIKVGIRAGSEERRVINIFPLNPEIHEIVETLRVGELIRVVGLRVRPDGAYVPQARTIVMRANQVPELKS